MAATGLQFTISVERMASGPGVKKIAVFLSEDPEGGGSFQYAQILVQALAGLTADQWRIRVWYRHPAWRDYLASLGLDSVRTGRIFALRKLAGAARRLCQWLPQGIREAILPRIPPNAAINAWKPDLIVNPGQHYIDTEGRLRQIAAIHHLMHVYEASFPEVGTAGERFHRDRLYQGMTRICSDILVDSRTGAQQVRDTYQPAATLHVLPFAAPDDLLRARPEAPSVALPEKFLFYPAQFWEHKNHARLAQAMSLATVKYPDIHCVLTGSQRYSGYARFLTQVEKSGVGKNFTLLGYVALPQVSWLYRHARAMVMPTFFGPTNIPPLEAMALGCPVAVSNIYGMPEQCGDAALYFQPGAPESIASALESLWTGDALCADLKAKGLARAALWTSTQVKAEFLRIFKEMAAQ